MRFTILAVLFLLLVSPTFAQEGVDWKTNKAASGTNFSFANFHEDLHFSLYAGPSVAIAMGDTIQQQRLLLQQFTEAIDTNTQTFRGSILPQVYFHFGAQVHYPINQWLGITSGLGYQQRGYRLSTSLEYRDPIYQYDEYFKIRQIVNMHYLELPLLAHFSPGSESSLSFTAGFTFGFPILKKQTLTKSKIKKDLHINGDREDEASYPFREEEWLLSEEVKSIVNATVGVQYQMNAQFAWQITGHYSNSLWRLPQSLKNTVANLSLVYHLR